VSLPFIGLRCPTSGDLYIDRRSFGFLTPQEILSPYSFRETISALAHP
jgi:hypothetical protein